MKRLVNKIVMIFMVGCIFFAVSGEVRAEKTLSPELVEILGSLDGDAGFYDCGTSTEDGAIQVRTGSHTLKEGDTIDVQLLYDKDKDSLQDNLYGWAMDVCYDENVLEYIGTNVPDEHKIKYGALDYSDVSFPGNLWLEVSYETKSAQINGLDKSDCVATVKYRVKKDISSTQIYFWSIALTSINANENEYRYKKSDGNGYNYDVLTLNLTDTSVTPSALNLSSALTQGSGEITVPINIEKNAGFNLLGLTLDYDTSLFTYESLEIADSLKSKISLDSVYESPGSGRIKASFIALEDITDVGDFLKLKLKVKDGVPAGTTSNVEVGIDQVGNKAETSMSGTGTTCAISITDTSGGEEQQPALGDVNADQKIDLVDAVYILQNYNQVREFTQAQETAADVTKDGNVNLVDALMIMKYFNGEITEF